MSLSNDVGCIRTDDHKLNTFVCKMPTQAAVDLMVKHIHTGVQRII